MWSVFSPVRKYDQVNTICCCLAKKGFSKIGVLFFGDWMFAHESVVHFIRDFVEQNFREAV